MAMVCVRLNESEVKMIDNLCLGMKKSRSDVLRYLITTAAVPVLNTDDWMLTFYHVFNIPMTQIKYALRMPANEMWAYICQRCPQLDVKQVGENYIVTLTKENQMFMANISAKLHSEAMLQLCAEKLEQEIIDGIYKAS